MASSHFDNFAGLKLVESTYLTQPGDPVQVRRSWRERWLSRPWRPWRATKTVVPQVPSPHLFQIALGVMVGHPATIRALREAVRSHECPECSGRGKYYDAPVDVLCGRVYEVPCESCNGTGRVRGDKTNG